MDRFDLTPVKETEGSLAILPRGVPHGFRNVGTTPGKILETITPAGFEKYFEELSQQPTDRPPHMEAIIAIAQRYWSGLDRPQTHRHHAVFLSLALEHVNGASFGVYVGRSKRHNSVRRIPVE